MKRMLMLLLLCLCVGMTECAPAMPANQNREETMQPTIRQASIRNEEFEITIFIDKESYAVGEAIECYAQLKYLGSEPITVYSGNPLLGFGVKDDVYFDGGYVIDENLVYNEFEPGETLRVEFSKSGGYTSDDPLVDFYKAYYVDSAFILPAGVFEISANINYSLDVEDMIGSKRVLFVSVVVTVE